MTQIFSEAGECIPVTVLAADANLVVQKKTPGKDGYSAVQLGADPCPARSLSKPLLGHLARAGVGPRRTLVESRISAEQVEALSPGQELGVELFQAGQRVDVIGTCKGRGTQGVVRRHHMKAMRASHGTHEYFRHGGSAGPGSFPGRVIKGLRMPGRMGNERVTTLFLEVVRVDPAERLLFLRGSVPGHVDGLVRVRPTVKRTVS
jgi:large subunit ribosomal protein L3